MGLAGRQVIPHDKAPGPKAPGPAVQTQRQTMVAIYELKGLERLLLVNERIGRAPRVRILRDHPLAVPEAEALAG